MRGISDIVADVASGLRDGAAFLTRLPVAATPASPAGGFLARAVPAFPLIGAAIGAFGGLVYAVAAALGLPPLVCAFAALAAVAALTGALHEDGLADFCDGIGGGHDRDQRLRIMRDSHNGTFGTLALVFSVGARVALLAAVAAPGPVLLAMVAAGALSRAALAPVMALLPPARPGGLAAAAGAPGRTRVIVALATAKALAWLCLGFGPALLALLAAAAAAAAVSALARRTLGGATGDVLGACQQAAEIAVLGVAAALAASP
ncbi:MAG: adenosylcobinamide-GDP ribazoletransferase [Rhodospirillales bacterium]|nr:adenosylcobinamide-GDP ribazoletransferase [Rhodospirillales bacterium]